MQRIEDFLQILANHDINCKYGSGNHGDNFRINKQIVDKFWLRYQFLYNILLGNAGTTRITVPDKGVISKLFTNNFVQKEEDVFFLMFMHIFSYFLACKSMSFCKKLDLRSMPHLSFYRKNMSSYRIVWQSYF